MCEHCKAERKGGPGSGNFGHEGRPGQVGGSSSEGGGGTSESGGKVNPKVEAWATAKFGSEEKGKAFAKWFGQSKVVDEKGEPLVVYHGTKAGFSTFDISKFGASDEGLVGRGFYFTYNPEEASGYAENEQWGRGESPNVMPLYVKMEKPFVITQGILPDGRSITELHRGGITSKVGKEIKNLAEAAGHDGVIFASRDGQVRHVVAWNPTQIKSATGNRGTFDPSDPNMNKAASLAPKSLAYRRKSWLRNATIQLWEKAERHAEADIEDAVLSFLRSQRADVVKELRRIEDEKPAILADEHAAERIIHEAFDPRDWDADLRAAIAPAIARTIARGYLSSRTVQAGRRRRFPPVWRKGGAGSGNFGHAGIPGHVGGSAPGEGGSGGDDRSLAHFSRGDSGGILVYHSTSKQDAKRLESEGIQQDALNRRDSGFFGAGFYSSAEPQDFYGKSIVAVELKPGAKLLDVGPLAPKEKQPWHDEFERSLRSRILRHRPDIPKDKLQAIVDAVTPGHSTFSHIEYLHEVASFARSEGYDVVSFAHGQETVVLNSEAVHSITHIGGIASARRHREERKVHLRFYTKADKPDPNKPSKPTSANTFDWSNMPLTESEIAEVMSFELPPNVTRAVFQHTKTIMEKPYWKDVNDTERQRMQWSVQQGIEEGKTLRQIAKDIQGDIGSDEIRARRIAVTESTGAFSAGAQAEGEAAEEAGVKIAKVWFSSGDDKVRPTHEEADGQVVEGSDGVFVVGGHECQRPGDPDLPAEERCNCILPGSRVQGSFVAGSKAFYSGQAVEVVTSTGRRLSLTPKHSVLTEHGMVPAGSLQEGDKVVAYDSQVDGVTDADDVDQAPSTIEQVFDTLRLRCDVTSGYIVEHRRAFETDFHGDGSGFQGKVEIVRPDRKLIDRLNTVVEKELLDSTFLGIDSALVVESSEGSGKNIGRQNSGSNSKAIGLLICRSLPSGRALPDNGRSILFERSPLEPLRIGTAAYLDFRIPENTKQSRSVVSQLVREALERFSGNVASDELAFVGEFDSSVTVRSIPAHQWYFGADEMGTQRRSTNSASVCDTVERNTGKVFLDEIVEVRNYDFCGHVYDLQSETGLIVADNIVVSNCHCGMANEPIIEAEKSAYITRHGKLFDPVYQQIARDEWEAKQAAVRTKATMAEAKGGAGSGNFGHAGIPGHVGGSAPGEGGGGELDNNANHESLSTVVSQSSALTQDDTDGSLPLYRGTREESREQGYTFWTPDRSYASGYSTSGDEVEQVYLRDDANIVDIRQAMDADGYVSGASLNELVPGLGEKFHLDDDDSVPLVSLWDVSGNEDFTSVAEHLRSSGYQGFRWIEDDGKEAFLIVHDEKKAASESVTKGGPGSGNFNHEGRPGEIGGSGSGGDSTSTIASTVSDSGDLYIGEANDYHATLSDAASSSNPEEAERTAYTAYESFQAGVTEKLDEFREALVDAAREAHGPDYEGGDLDKLGANIAKVREELDDVAAGLVDMPREVADGSRDAGSLDEGIERLHEATRGMDDRLYDIAREYLDGIVGADKAGN